MKPQQAACTAIEPRTDSISPFAIALFVSAIALLVLVNRGTPTHAAAPGEKAPTPVVVRA